MRQAIVFLTQREIEQLAEVYATLRVVRDAFIALARGGAVMPPKIYLPLPHGNDFRAMPAYQAHPPACGVKWVNVHPRNPRRGLPTIMALIVLNDPATGLPLAVMDGMVITKLRTAASAAVAAQVLSRPDSRLIGLIGCGAQADAQVVALAAVRPVEWVRVWGYFPQEAMRFCRRMRRQMPRVAFEPCATIERCVRGVDVVVTITPSRRPLIQRAWLSPGVHINAIGADAPGKQELDPKILREATVIVDDYEQAIHGGELNVPVRRRQYDPDDIHASLGEILIGRRRARQRAQELTVFDSTGLAIHDVALGAHLLRQAIRRRVGHRLHLLDSSPVV